MKDVLFHIDTYAEPTSVEAVDQVVAFAAAVGCRLTGMAVQIDIRTPDNWLAEKLLHINRLAIAEESKSLEAGRAMLKHLATAAQAAGVLQEGLIIRADLNGVGSCVARRARTHDMCVIAVGQHMYSQRTIAEDVIFGSGRPALIFNPAGTTLPAELKRVVVAWDGSRSAVRVVSDGLPLLQKAQEVRLLTVVGEKTTATSGLASDLARHLKLHGVACVIDEVDGRGRSIGSAFDEYCERYPPSLFVMGGYGTSRLKQFILGGATEHMFNTGRVATVLSH
jgi:nucleotide-binding universal stress UspA family protein